MLKEADKSVEVREDGKAGRWLVIKGKSRCGITQEDKTENFSKLIVTRYFLQNLRHGSDEADLEYSWSVR